MLHLPVLNPRNDLSHHFITKQRLRRGGHYHRPIKSIFDSKRSVRQTNPTSIRCVKKENSYVSLRANKPNQTSNYEDNDHIQHLKILKQIYQANISSK